MITKFELDKLVEKYENIDFIKDDPIQFSHKTNKKEDIELYGFISSLFAYGNRKLFIKKLDEIFSKMEGDISGYIKNGDFSLSNNKKFVFDLQNDINEMEKNNTFYNEQIDFYKDNIKKMNGKISRNGNSNNTNYSTTDETNDKTDN